MAEADAPLVDGADLGVHDAEPLGVGPEQPAGVGRDGGDDGVGSSRRASVVSTAMRASTPIQAFMGGRQGRWV